MDMKFVTMVLSIIDSMVIRMGAASLSRTPCTISVPTRSPLETLELTFTVKCAGPTRFALPVTFNAYSTVYVKGKGGELDTKYLIAAFTPILAWWLIFPTPRAR